MQTRNDGRKYDDLRPLTIEFDGLARVDGSARFSFGPTTSALASVSGPIEVRLAAEQPSKATFEVSVRPLSGTPGIEAKSLAATVRNALLQSLLLSQHPRTLIQLVVQALSPSSSGTKWESGLTAAMINASTLALLNAGSVPMRGVVCAVSVARLDSSSIVVDPSVDEFTSAQVSGCFAFLFSTAVSPNPNDSDCTCVWSTWTSQPGSKTTAAEDELMRARDIAKGAVRRIWAAMKESIPAMDAANRSSSSLAQRYHSKDDDNDDKMEI